MKYLTMLIAIAVASPNAFAHTGHGIGELGHSLDHSVWLLAMALAIGALGLILKPRLQRLWARLKKNH